MSGGLGATRLGRRLIANTLHAASGRVAAVLAWVILTPAILSALGAEGFAVWALFFALTGYFAALDLGLVQGTLRYVAAARERGAEDEAGAFSTLGLVGFFALGLLWLGLVTLLREQLMAWLRVPPAEMSAAGFAMVVGAAVFALAGCANVTIATLQGYGRFDLANLVSLAATVQQVAGIVLTLRQGWGLWGLVVSVGAGWAVGLLTGVVVLRRAVPAFRWGSSRQALAHVRDLLAFGGPMQIASLMAILHAHLDKFLLPALVAFSAVTPYELGSRVLGSIQAFPQMLLLAMLPVAAALHATGDSPRLRELYFRGDRYLLTAIAVMLAFLIASASRLCTAWLGAGHEDAALVLRGLSAAAGFMLATGMASVTARAVGRTDLEAWSSVVVVTLHLGLSLLLLPRLGLAGALVAVFASNLVGGAFFLFVVGRLLGQRPRDVLVKPHMVPLIAVAAGVAVGIALDRVLPVAGGLVAWALLGLVAAAASAVALGTTLATGYFQWREVRALLLTLRAPATPAAGEAP